MNKAIETKIGQLNYEISLLEHSKEELTGVTIRTEELRDLIKNLTIPVVVKSFTAEEVVNELKENETLDDAISYFDNLK